MQILLKASKTYEFVATEENPTQEQLSTGEFRYMASGELRKTVVIDNKTECSTNVPDDQIDRLFEHFERNKIPKTKKEVYAWYLEEKVLPYLAPRSGWTKFIVDKDKDLEKYLNTRFELKG